MTRQEEFAIKTAKIDKYLANAGADGVILSRCDFFSWATCGGASHVNIAQDCGVASFAYISGKAFIFTNNIEHPRILDEEIAGLPIEIVSNKWYEEATALKEFTANKKVLTDAPLAGLAPLPADFAELFYDLTPSELDRYREVGRLTGEALQAACKAIKPGMTEYQIAGLLAGACHDNTIVPTVNLIAADARTMKYRHPIPSFDNTFNKSVMVVVCGRKYGLIASATRMVCVGAPDAQLRKKHDAVVNVDMTFNTLTRPGKTFGEIFRAAQQAYADGGYAGDWELHHQGGDAGYRGRYRLGGPAVSHTILVNSAFAWNPSITGTKSEDTILVLEDRNEFITAVPGWPTISLQANGMAFDRADILSI